MTDATDEEREFARRLFGRPEPTEPTTPPPTESEAIRAWVRDVFGGEE